MGRPAAVVVYRHAKHVINLFTWASPGKNEAFREETRQGFNVVTWRHDGIKYYAVSDVEADQLVQFATLVAQG
jgi:anti-sigma factor RsiW